MEQSIPGRPIRDALDEGVGDLGEITVQGAQGGRFAPPMEKA
jgi:hypothetical protein